MTALSRANRAAGRARRGPGFGAAAAAALFAIAGGCAEACQSSSRLVEVEDALLAEAMGYVEAPGEDEAETLALTPGQTEVEIPAADVIRLAVDREVPFGQAMAVLEDIERAGSEAALLVSRRGTIRRFELEDEFDGRAGIEVLGFPSGGGWKSCVRPRGGDEAKCVKQPGGEHIDGAFTRDLVREAVGVYGDDRAVVGVPINLPWADAVRLIDGARTCCLDERARVEIVHLDQRGAPLDEDVTDVGAQEMGVGEGDAGEGDAGEGDAGEDDGEDADTEGADTEGAEDVE